MEEKDSYCQNGSERYQEQKKQFGWNSRIQIVRIEGKDTQRDGEEGCRLQNVGKRG